MKDINKELQNEYNLRQKALCIMFILFLHSLLIVFFCTILSV